MKVGLEVSNIINTITRTSGSQVYTIGTRNASTTLRLKDGETQILAGLIQRGDFRTTNKVPGLSSLPVLGRLFSNNNDDIRKTEIVLLITPRIMRNIVRPPADFTEFASGTETSMGGLAGSPQGPLNPPSMIEPPSPAFPAPAPAPKAPTNATPGSPGGPPPMFPPPASIMPGAPGGPQQP